MPARRLEYRPLTRARWPDLERLFGKRGASGGCWCTWWRLPRSRYLRQRGAGNKRAFRSLVADRRAGEAPGIIAYVDGEAAGWCAIAPRKATPVLERSRVLKRVDDAPVWSITCFYIPAAHRRRGMSVALLRAAADYVRRRGGGILEGYPVEPGAGTMPAAFAWTGFGAAFRAAGFKEVARRSPTRPIMRLEVGAR